MQTKAPSFSSRLIRLMLLLLLVTFLAAGCGSSSGGKKKKANPDGDNGGDTGIETLDPGLNTSYYGTYNVSADIGACHDDFTLTIGNDTTRALEENYIYLPEEGDFTSVEGISATREGLAVTYTLTESAYSYTLTITFAEDLSSATLSGTISDDDPNACSGAISGTITLVTRAPAEISDAYLQYRLFPGDQDSHVAWIQVSQDGSLLAESGFNGVPQLLDANGTALETTQAFYSSDFMTGTYNSESQAVDFDTEPASYSGYLLTAEQAFTQGSYTLAASVNQDNVAYTIKKTILYPGDPVEALDVITILTADMATASKAVGEYGPITLSWIEPALPQDVFVTISKKDQALLEIKVPAPADAATAQTTSLTIPADQVLSLLTRADAMTAYDILTVQLETRGYTEDGMNHVRTYSDRVAIPGTDTGSDYDNSGFYGAYKINYAGDAPSITIGDNPDSACFDDYLYLPSDTLSVQTECAAGTVSATRSADTLTLTRGGETLVFAFNNAKTHADVTPSGTADLITRTPAVVEFAAIIGHYNNNDGGFDGQNIQEAFTIDGAEIDPEDIVSLKIYSDINEEPDLSITDPNSFFKTSFLAGSYGGSTLTTNDYSWTGINLEIQELFALPAGDYLFVATLVHNGTDSYTVTRNVASPGNADDDGPEPVQTGDRIFSLVINGDMSITVPITNPNYDNLYINIIERIENDVDFTFEKIMSIQINESGIIGNEVNLLIPWETVSTFYTSENAYFLELVTQKSTETETVINRAYMYKKLVIVDPSL